MIVGGGVVVGERPRPAGGEVVGGVLLHDVERKDPLARLPQHHLVHVGRVDAAAVVQPFLLQQNRQRVDLFAGRAARLPDADERIGAKQRDGVLPKREEEPRIAEHRADVHRQPQQHAARGMSDRGRPSPAGPTRSTDLRRRPRRARAAAATSARSRGSRTRTGGRSPRAAARFRDPRARSAPRTRMPYRYSQTRSSEIS